MEGKLSEFQKLVVLVQTQDVGTADITSAYQSLKGYRRARLLALSGILADTNTFTVQLMQSKVGGASPKVLGTLKTFTSVGAQNGKHDLDILPGDLDVANDYCEVGVVVGSNTNAKLGTAVLTLDKAGNFPVK